MTRKRQPARDHVGARLAVERERLGLTQEDVVGLALADRVSVTIETLSRVENGRSPNENTTKAYAAAFAARGSPVTLATVRAWQKQDSVTTAQRETIEAATAQSKLARWRDSLSARADLKRAADFAVQRASVQAAAAARPATPRTAHDKRVRKLAKLLVEVARPLALTSVLEGEAGHRIAEVGIGLVPAARFDDLDRALRAEQRAAATVQARLIAYLLASHAVIGGIPPEAVLRRLTSSCSISSGVAIEHDPRAKEVSPARPARARSRRPGGAAALGSRRR